ncbi:MAG: N-acetylneuraminate synthase family protein [Candidatus Yanofskybacteria bacterium]|nr:N-acetylneuraminate synthase family protein [Candidatus Yanofskybacteria bacterium]
MLKIGSKEIGYNQPVFIVAEIGINHNGDIEIAKKLIDGAVAQRCDAVKFQKRTVPVVYTAEELAKPRQVNEGVLRNAVRRGVLSDEAVKRLTNSDFENSTNGDLKWALELTQKEYREIDRYCRQKGILWFASPWDEGSVDFLEQFDLPCYKIASACNLDRNLMAHIKAKGKPIIVSVGMTDDERIEKIVKFLGKENLVILHCTSTYPGKDNELHLANIPRLIKKYPKVHIGYSGHEVGVYSSLVAASLGACVIERHITLDRAMWGTDQAASLELYGLGRLTVQLRDLPIYLGQPAKVLLDSEKPIEAKLRRKNTLE